MAQFQSNINYQHDDMNPQQQENYNLQQYKHQEEEEEEPTNYLPKLLGVGTLLAAFNCFERGDYNLGLYPLIFLLLQTPNEIKDLPKQLVRMTYLLIFSLFVDLVWFIYWSGEYNTYLDVKSGVYEWMGLPIHATIIISAIGFLLKIAIVYFMATDHKNVSDALSIEQVFELGSSFFSSDDNNTQSPPPMRQHPNDNQVDKQYKQNYGYEDNY